MARRLKLRNLPEYAEYSSGQAIETAASRADNPFEFEFTPSLLQYRNCNFSFAGIKNQMTRHIIQEEKKYDVPPDGVIPSVNNLCAAFQYVITSHLCHRLQRAIEYVKLKNLISVNNQSLVVSGGVACNNFIAKGLKIVCDELDYKLIRPPAKLCTDNGVMIAWNGVEKWKIQKDILHDLSSILIEKSSPLGKNIIEEVASAKVRPKWVKLKGLFDEEIEQNKIKVNL